MKAKQQHPYRFPIRVRGVSVFGSAVNLNPIRIVCGIRLGNRDSNSPMNVTLRENGTLPLWV